MKKKDLLKKLKLLELESEDQRNSVVCSLIGHSKIIDICFGYVYCARCNDKIGDTLAGIFDTSSHVVVGHDCDTCHTNYETLTWKDKLYCPDPFTEAVKK